MIPPINIEFPKIVDDTIYYISGGTIIEENIPPLSVEEMRDILQRTKENLN